MSRYRSDLLLSHTAVQAEVGSHHGDFTGSQGFSEKPSDRVPELQQLSRNQAGCRELGACVGALLFPESTQPHGN